MRIASLSLALVAALAVGCSAGTEEDLATSSEAAYSTGPDGLAHWLQMSHTVRYMGQFLDWRPGAKTPFLFGPLAKSGAPLFGPLGESGAMAIDVAFPPAVFESPEVEAMMKIARQADDAALPINVGQEPAPGGDGDLLCVPAGVHVYPGRASWVAAIPQAYTGPEERALVDAAVAGTTTEVLIALPGDDVKTPMLRLAFGIVNRPQSAKPDAPVMAYWTILGASIGEARCAPRTRTVFSMSSRNDNLLTNNEAERASLLQNGWYAQTKPGRGDFDLAVADGPGEVGVYRCRQPGSGLHFFSVSATCEGASNEGLLGFASAAPSATAARSLRRCYQSYNQFTHVLGDACQAGARDDGIIGWVR